MPRDLDLLTTSEMTNPEWKRYIREWKKECAEFLVLECGITKKAAKEQAEYDFERYSGQEGYTGRDEKILMRRERERERERKEKWEDDGDYESELERWEATQAEKAEQYYENNGLLFVNAADDDDCPF